MEKLRPFVAAVLGLMLCVQGAAIAAAPVAAAQTADSAMDMPCHGDEAPSASHCDCCDGDCANMAGCAIGQLGGVPAVLPALGSMPQAAVTTHGWSLKTAILPLPVRPPIVSHA